MKGGIEVEFWRGKTIANWSWRGSSNAPYELAADKLDTLMTSFVTNNCFGSFFVNFLDLQLNCEQPCGTWGWRLLVQTLLDILVPFFPFRVRLNRNYKEAKKIQIAQTDTHGRQVVRSKIDKWSYWRQNKWKKLKHRWPFHPRSEGVG